MAKPALPFEITTKRIGKYCDVELKADNTHIACGLHDDEEAKHLARHLREVIEALIGDEEELKEFLNSDE